MILRSANDRPTIGQRSALSPWWFRVRLEHDGGLEFAWSADGGLEFAWSDDGGAMMVEHDGGLEFAWSDDGGA
jgi:hypothetical protein